jgi:hypothetical protein
MPQSARHVIVRAVGLAHGVKFVVQRLAFGRPEQRADHNQQQHQRKVTCEEARGAQRSGRATRHCH